MIWKITMELDKLKQGQSAIVQTVGGDGALRQHFLDMGLIPGAEITLVKFALPASEVPSTHLSLV